MTKPRKLDAATEKQAIAFVRKHIELSGGDSQWSSGKMWRAARKYELCGQLELPEDVERRFAEMSERLYLKPRIGPAELDNLELYRRAIRIQRTLAALFSKRPWTWNEEAEAKLIANAKQGNADADQLLRDLAAEFLERPELPPKPLRDYAATSLRAHSGRKQKRQRLENEGRNGHLALITHAVCRIFDLEPTRNREVKNTKNDYRSDCACSIVAKAINKSESLITKIWEKYKDFDRGARDLVAEFIELDYDLEQIISGTVPGAGISGRAAWGSAFRKATCGPATR
jgi:hypothetical protein